MEDSKVEKTEQVKIENKEVKSKEEKTQIKKSAINSTPKVEDETMYKEEPKKQTNNNNYLPYWTKVIDGLKTKGKIILYTNLIGTKARKVNDLQIEIEFAGKITSFAKSVLEQHENKEEIMKMVSMEEGTPMQIKYVDGENRN
jgi:hypothetical protein